MDLLVVDPLFRCFVSFLIVFCLDFDDIQKLSQNEDTKQLYARSDILLTMLPKSFCLSSFFVIVILFILQFVTIRGLLLSAMNTCEFEAPPALKSGEYNTDLPLLKGSVDLVVPSETGYNFLESQDFGAILRAHKKAVLFAVPGAFTPTCSAKHLPGFIERADEIRAKGVEEIYCLSVNDKYVMKSWAESTQNCLRNRIVLVADGNAEFTSALNAVNDRRSGRMGIRSQRYALIVENGAIVYAFRDSSGLANSSAENILLHL